MATNELLECLNAHDGKCNGPVEWRSTGDAYKAWPRCTFHGEKREEQYWNSMERYANSDVAPSWFDPTYAGEVWNDE